MEFNRRCKVEIGSHFSIGFCNQKIYRKKSVFDFLFYNNCIISFYLFKFCVASFVPFRNQAKEESLCT